MTEDTPREEPQEKDKGGRPPIVFDEEQIIQIEALAAVLNVEQVADYMGISKTAFYNVMQRQPEVYERYKKGSAKAVEETAKKLLEKCRGGELAAIIFYLKTRGRWKETQGVEVSGPDGGPVQTVTRRIIDPDNR